MDLETTEKMLEILKGIAELRQGLIERSEKETCPIKVSLEKEYNQFMVWALGEDYSNFEGAQDIRNKWNELHEDIEFPSSLEAKDLCPKVRATLLSIQVGHHYRQAKKRKCCS